MTPAEVKAMTIPEYLAFNLYMDKDLRAQRRAQRQRAAKKR